MATICVSREHDLEPGEARGKVEELAEMLQRKFGVNYHWVGDCLHFKRSGGAGVIDISVEGMVKIDIKLGIALRPMKGLIESSIHQGFDKVLARNEGSKDPSCSQPA